MTPRNGRYAVSINADDDDDQIQITWEQVGWVYVPEIAPNSQSSAGWWSVQPPQHLRHFIIIRNSRITDDEVPPTAPPYRAPSYGGQRDES